MENTDFLSTGKGPWGSLFKPPIRRGLGPRPCEERGRQQPPTWPAVEAGTGEVRGEMEQVPKKARLQGERGLCRWVQRVPKTMHGRGCFSLWKCWGLRPHPQRLGSPPPPPPRLWELRDYPIPFPSQCTRWKQLELRWS